MGNLRRTLRGSRHSRSAVVATTASSLLLLLLCLWTTASPADAFVVPSSSLTTTLRRTDASQPSQSTFPTTTTTAASSALFLSSRPQQPTVSSLLALKAAASVNDPSSFDDATHNKWLRRFRRRLGGWRRLRDVLVLRAWTRRCRQWLKKMVVMSTLLLLVAAKPLPAAAKYSHELTTAPTTSLRPGMSRTTADALEAGSLSRDEVQEYAPSVFSSSSSSSTSTSTSTATKARDYDDEDDDDDLDDLDWDEDFMNQQAPPKSTIPSRADESTTSSKLQSQQRDHFASYHKGKSQSLTMKVGAVIGVPAFGFNVVRETLRRRREEQYVLKGLEIQRAQKAEYFNVTSTTDDADVEDELKGLKQGNETKTDGDDDDDDDDDDDADDEPPRARRTPPPKRPTPGGGGDGDGSSGNGGSDDLGYGRPSDDDVDRLKNLFNKS